MADPKTLPIGLPWVREEDYEALLAIFEDPDNWRGSFEQRVRALEGVERKFKDTGQAVRRIYINPLTFPAWCAKNSRRVTTESAERFAAEIAIKEQRNAGGDW